MLKYLSMGRLQLIKKLFYIKDRPAQILVETMVALSMVVIGLLGLLALVTNSIGLNKVVSDQYVATYLAMEGVEIIKYKIDDNIAGGVLAFNSGISNSGYYKVAMDSSNPDGFKIEYISESEPEFGDNNYKISFDSNSKKYWYASGDKTNFVRVVKITNNGDSISVDSNVNWVSRGNLKTDVHIDDIFYNWRS